MPVIGNFGPGNTSLKTVHDYEKHTQKKPPKTYPFLRIFCPRPYTANERWTLKRELTNDRVYVKMKKVLERIVFKINIL